jgi:hypothetical protein
MNDKIFKIASISFETTGISNHSLNKAVNQQILSAGIIIADSDNFKSIETCYIEIKPNKDIVWNNKFEKIHGFTKDYLIKNGIIENEAAAIIADILVRHFDDIPIVLLGHNVSSFSYWFLYNILDKYNYYRDLNLFISSRVLDTFTLGKTLYGFNTFNEILDFLQLSDIKLNSREKAEVYLKFFRICKKQWNIFHDQIKR